jgi:hypothetical protein
MEALSCPLGGRDKSSRPPYVTIRRADYSVLRMQWRSECQSLQSRNVEGGRKRIL